MAERVDSTGVSREILNKSPFKILFKADESCFPAYADKTSDYVPACASCGKPSVGASFIEMQSHSLIGRTVGVVQFSCGCDGRKSFALTVQNLYPGWRLLSEREPGIWTVAHLSPEQKSDRCSQVP